MYVNGDRLNVVEMPMNKGIDAYLDILRNQIELLHYETQVLHLNRK